MKNRALSFCYLEAEKRLLLNTVYGSLDVTPLITHMETIDETDMQASVMIATKAIIVRDEE